MSAERPQRKSNSRKPNIRKSSGGRAGGNRKSGAYGDSRSRGRQHWGKIERQRSADRKDHQTPKVRKRGEGSDRGGNDGLQDTYPQNYDLENQYSEAQYRRNKPHRDKYPRTKHQQDNDPRDNRRPQHDAPERSGTSLPADESPDLLFGRHAVLAALGEGRTLNKIWVIPQVRYNAKFHNLLDKAKSNGAVIDEVSMQRLSSITKGGKHQGIAAQAAPYEYADLQALIEQSLTAKNDPLIVVADGIQDPHNLGAIARTTEAMGGHGLIVPQRRAVGVTSTVMKVAAGALETLPIAREVNLVRAIEHLKAAGFWIYGTGTSGDKSVYEVEFSGPTAIVIGAEGKGLGLRVENTCDYLLSIPMAGKTESLNASVAAGMILSEINRQRLQKTLKLPVI